MMQIVNVCASGSECDWCKKPIDERGIVLKNIPYGDSLAYVLFHNRCAQYMALDILAALGDDSGRRLLSMHFAGDVGESTKEED